MADRPAPGRVAAGSQASTVRALGEDLGPAAGELLGAAGQSGVIDAAVVLIAHDGGDNVTSDPAPTCGLRPPQARATSS